MSCVLVAHYNAAGPPAFECPAPTAPKRPALVNGAPYETSAPVVVHPLQEVNVVVENFEPGSTVRVTLFSDPVPLGTYPVAPDGVADISVTLPDAIDPGVHRLELAGTSPAGAIRTISINLLIEGAPIAGESYAIYQDGFEPFEEVSVLIGGTEEYSNLTADEFGAVVAHLILAAEADEPFQLTITGSVTGDAPIVTVSPTVPSSPPNAVDDNETTMLGTSITVDALANDSDPDDDLDESSLSIVSPPALGTAVVVDDGEGPVIEYTPASAGVDTLTYEVCDDTGQCDTATVTITVLAESDCTILGTAGADTLTGTEGPDIICGRGGKDIINGLGGDDIIFGGRGSDTVDGGAGDDLIFGGRGGDELHGGEGADLIRGRRGADTIFGDGGDDELHGGKGNDTVHGGPGDDLIFGGRGADELHGGDGADVIRGRQGSDTIFGDGGDDELRGGKGNDTIDGGTGDDLIFGGRGSDTVDGGAGDDLIFGGRGGDELHGGDGADVIRGRRGSDMIFGDGGDDELHGGKGNDTGDGGDGDDSCRNIEHASNCEF